MKSNRESRKGRSDIFMKTTGISRRAVIFECKVLGGKEDAEEKCKEALRQIEDKEYEYDLMEE